MSDSDDDLARLDDPAFLAEQKRVHGEQEHTPANAAHPDLTALYRQAQARHPHWGIWISSAGRYWASRRGNIRVTEHAHPGWAMTIDADSLAELETRISKQEEYGQDPAGFPGDFEDPQEIPEKGTRRDDH
jgi:hypothetical protein